jgi:hypothetical protein
MEITPEIQALLDAQKATLDAEYTEKESGLRKNRDALLEEKRLIAEEKEAIASKIKLDAEQALQAKAASDGDTQALLEQIKANKETTKAEKDALVAEIESMKRERVDYRLSKLADAFVGEFAKDDKFIKSCIARDYMKRIDERDGKTVVLDSNGNLTANTIEDLNKEFIGADLYKEYIKGTMATGGGATGNKGGGAAGDARKHITNTTSSYLATTKK